MSCTSERPCHAVSFESWCLGTPCIYHFGMAALKHVKHGAPASMFIKQVSTLWACKRRT